MIGDQAKAAPKISIVMIIIDIRAMGEVRQISTIMKEEAFLPALMLDTPESLVKLLTRISFIVTTVRNRPFYQRLQKMH